MFNICRYAKPDESRLKGRGCKSLGESKEEEKIKHQSLWPASQISAIAGKDMWNEANIWESCMKITEESANILISAWKIHLKGKLGWNAFYLFWLLKWTDTDILKNDSNQKHDGPHCLPLYSRGEKLQWKSIVTNLEKHEVLPLTHHLISLTFSCRTMNHVT